MSGWDVKTPGFWPLPRRGLAGDAGLFAQSESARRRRASIVAAPRGTGSPGADHCRPAPLGPPPSARAAVGAGRTRGSGRPRGAGVTARYGRDAPQINGGLIWRVYAAEARRDRSFPLIKEDRRRDADFRAAAGQLCGACEPRSRQRREVRAIARRRRARSFGYSGRRHAARRPRRRHAHPARADIASTSSRAASSTPASAGRSRRTS